MCRAVKPGGTIGAYVWDYSGDMQLMRYFWSGVRDLFPDGAERDEGRQFPICKPEALAALQEPIARHCQKAIGYG
jgi:hypothetical protein